MRRRPLGGLTIAACMLVTAVTHATSAESVVQPFGSEPSAHAVQPLAPARVVVSEAHATLGVLDLLEGAVATVNVSTNADSSNPFAIEHSPERTFERIAALTAGIHIEKETDGQDADTPTGPQIPAGSDVNFGYVVTNTGDVALRNIVVDDDNGTPDTPGDDVSPAFVTGDFNGNDLLDVDETWFYTATRTVTPGQHASVATVSADGEFVGPASDSDPSHHFGLSVAVDIEKSTNGQDADTATGPQLVVGDTATFDYVVSNTGSEPLGEVTVIDDNGTPGAAFDDFSPTFLGGDANENALLDINETWQYRATRTVTPGQHGNLATATGNDVALGQASDSDPSHHFGLAIGLHIEASTNGEDADIPTGPQLAAGDTATFGYVVSNTGNAPVGNIVVTDDNGTQGVAGDDFNPAFVGGDTNSNSMLDLTETWSYTATRTVTAGQHANIATVTGDEPTAGPAGDSDPSHHFGVSVVAIDIEKSTNDQDADSPIGPQIPAGDAATFRYVVTNPGNLAVGNIVVTDDNGTQSFAGDDFNPTFESGDTNGDLQLDPTEIWTYVANRPVTAGQHASIATVTGDGGAAGQASDSDPSHYFGIVAVIDIEKETNALDADTPTGPQLPVGNLAIFGYLVTNVGNAPLANVTIVDDNGTPGTPGDDFNPTFVTGDGNNNGLLDLTEIWLYTADRRVTPGQYTSIAAASASHPSGALASDSDPSLHFGLAASVDIEKSTNGQDADVPTGPQLAVGDTATFDYVVVNTGNVALTNVVVVDDHGTPLNTLDDFSPTFVGGDADDDDLLDPGETWTYTATRIVTPGQHGNVATVSGVNASAGPASDSDPSHHFGLVIGIDIEKSTNGVDADTPAGPQLLTGSTAVFGYVVTNTGNAPLGNVLVVDDNGTPGTAADDFSPSFVGGDTDGDAQLDVSEIWTYSATRSVTPGQYVNNATVAGTGPSDGQASDSDPSHHLGGTVGIDIEKSTEGEDADTPTGPRLVFGQTVTFAYVVRNLGDVLLRNVVVVDDNGTPGAPGDDFSPTFVGGDTDDDNLLDPGETWTYSASRTVTAGQHGNIATVTGRDPALGETSDSDPSHHFGVLAGIDVEKSTNGQDADTPSGPRLAVGDTATFEYVVTNTGNVPLSEIVVTDDNDTPGAPADDFNPTFTGGDTNGNVELDVTETWTYAATRTVTAGQHVSLAAVTGDEPTVGPVGDTDPSHHFGWVAGIDIETSTNGQDADTPTGPLLAVGSTALFRYVVTNTGNVPMANVLVVDDGGTPGTSDDDFVATFAEGDTNGDTLLDPSESWSFTAARTVTAGQYANTATVTGQEAIAGQATDSDSSHHFGQLIGIDIEKSTNGEDADSPTGPQLRVGSTVTFTYRVTNTGTAPLGNVLVVDDNGTPGTAADDFNPNFVGGDTNNDAMLDLTETWSYTALRTVSAGQHSSNSEVTGNGPDADQASDIDASHHLGVIVAIDIEKSTNSQDADSPTGPVLASGDVASFVYVISNVGDVVLGNVVVVDDNGTPGTPADDFNPTYVFGDANGNAQLDLTETWLYTASRTVIGGQYRNVATVTGDDAALGQASDSDASHHFGLTIGIEIENSINGQDADTPTGPQLQSGSTATLGYTVTNTGNAPLGNVSVVDDNATPGTTLDDFSPTFVGGDTNGDALLDVSETWTYTASRPVTIGQYVNHATVTGDDPTAGQASDNDPSHHLGFGVLGIHIEKETNGQDADEPTGPRLPAGSLVIFGYLVTNTGEVPLGNVVVVDDNGTPAEPGDDFNPVFVAGDSNDNAVLDINETWLYTDTRRATPGQHTSIATVTGEDTGVVAVSDSDPSNHLALAAAIDIEHSTNGVDADDPTSGDAPQIAPGDPVSWSYAVTNIGGDMLQSVAVTDNQGVEVSCPKTSLAAGEAMTCSASGIAEQLTYTTPATVVGTCGGAGAVLYENTATARAESPDAQLVEDVDPSHYCNPVPAELSVCSTSKRGLAMPGGWTKNLNVQRFFSVDPVSCPTGFVVAWAVDADQQPIEWNHLVGSTYIRAQGGPGLNRTEAAQALGILGDPGDLVEPMEPLVGAQGGESHFLPFDDVAYAEMPLVLRTDFVATNGPRGSRITLLNPNVNLPQSNQPMEVGLRWWNEAGDEFSSSPVLFRCHVRKHLDDIGSAFTLGALGSYYGSLEAAHSGAASILGVLEEIEPSRLTMRNMFHQGPSSPSTVINRGGRQPGSALIFPLFDLTPVDGVPGITIQRITNTFFDKTLEIQPVVNVQFMLICGQDDT